MEESEELREALHRASDWVAEYIRDPRRYPVLSRARPGELLGRLPASPPEVGEPLHRLLDDFEELVVPGITHWNHPRFFAYFAITGSAPGILAELLCAALNVNAMLWRTSPAATELEEVATSWVREAIGLPLGFFGLIADTASSSTLFALAAARERESGGATRRAGVLPGLRVYLSAEAHSSVEKAAVILGIGGDNCVRIPVDAEFRMRPGALGEAIARDRAAGLRPLAVVGTVGTTSTTSIDPIGELADVAAREGLWLHIDAAYGGAAAVVPEMRWVLDGCDRADSLVVNPHKWLFTPVDCSVLLIRHPGWLRAATSLSPHYLTTAEDGAAINLMDYGYPLGRRFRALKLWFTLRALGLAGARAAIRNHVEWAQELRRRLEADPEWEVLAPSPFSTVVFRFRGSDEDNAAIEETVNQSGEAFISHTSVEGRYALRVAVGNLRTTFDDVMAVYQLLCAATKKRYQTPSPTVESASEAALS